MMKMKRLIIYSFMAAIACSVVAIASDVTANFTILVQKGSLNVQRTAAQSLSIVHSAPNVSGFTQLIPTNIPGTAISLGSISTNGIAWMRNLGTNYIEIGVTNGGSFAPLIRLGTNEAWCVRITPGIAPYARANTVGTVLEFLLFDN